MSGRSDALTARRAPCPTCNAPRFEYCVGPDGELKERSHDARIIAARGESDLTPGQLEMLHRLHVDPTRAIPPIMRRGLLRRGLIEPAPDPGPTPGHRRGKPPRRRHPLTEAGRAAIGAVAADAERAA